ncbi:RIP metalloprotease RseP, partial [Comamonas sp.]
AGQGDLRLSVLAGAELNQAALDRIGITMPWTPAVVGDLTPGMPAQKAGLQAGDVVLRVDGRRVNDGAQLRMLIRQVDANQRVPAQQWQVARNGKILEIAVQPELVETPEGSVARIGALIGGAPEWVLVQKNFVDGLTAGVVKTWEVSLLSLQMMAKMVTGQASLDNLSGPLTIADYAGKSASMGLVQYILFLALISVSLGVLNLLPLPVLDGGHLMYYLWEGVTGHPVSDVWAERLQRVGIGLLLVMMSIALFNDISRIWG